MKSLKATTRRDYLLFAFILGIALFGEPAVNFTLSFFGL